MAIQKRASAGDFERNGNGLAGCDLKKRYPSLCEFLEATTYEDGSPRVVPTLTLFLEYGTLKACLNNRDESVVAFISAGSLTGILEALEEGLVMDSLDWRLSLTGNKKKPRSA